MPVLHDSISLNTEFKYNILSKAMITGNEIEPITPARLGKERKQPLKTSYFKAGVGNYNTFFGDLSFNVLQSERFVLGFDIGHWSSFGNLTLQNDEKVDAPFHDTWGKLGFDYLFLNKTLYTKIDFRHNIYDYYGYNNIDPAAEYSLLNTPAPVTGDLLIPDTKQRLSGVDVTLGFKNNELRDDRIIYDARLGYLSFGNLTGVSQNGFNIGGNVYIPFGTVGFKVDLDIRYNNTSVPDSIGPLYSFNQRKNTLIGISPQMVFNFDVANIYVGLLMYGEADTFDDEFQLAPILKANLNIVEGVVSMEGGIKGHYDQNDYRTAQYENPFISPDKHMKTAFYGLDAFVSLKGNFSKSVSFAADVSYSMFSNEHFYVNKFYLNNTDTVLQYTNLFAPVYDDGSLLTLSGELLYRPTDKFNVSTKISYYGWKTDSLTRAWHKPEIEFMVNSRFSPIEDLWIDAGINVLGKRYAFDPTEWSEVKLKAVFDLNIGAEYLYNSTWSFFARINNLASSKYYQWYGYPMQRLNLHVGVGISF
jgi:hypothetical protein